MALQKRPPSAHRQIEGFIELAERNADDALHQRGWAYQPDLTIRECLAGELRMNIRQQRWNLDHVTRSQHFEQIAFAFSIEADKPRDARQQDVYGVGRFAFLVDD